MKAVVTRGYEDSTVEEVPRPSPGRGEVLIEASRVQLSVTECWTWQGLFWGNSLQERIDAQDGLIFGHEFAGEVVEFGEGVEEFSVANRVYEPGKVSSEDAVDRDGWSLVDTNKATVGTDGYPDPLAEYFVAPTESLCELPDGITDVERATMQPLAGALLSVHEAGIDTDDIVVVYGSNGLTGRTGRPLYGASGIYAVDVDPWRLEWTEEFGMIPIDARDEDPVKRVREVTDGTGTDVAHSTQGDDPLAQCFEMLRVDETINQIGIHTGDIQFGMQEMRMKRIDVDSISVKSVLATSPNMDTGEWAVYTIANDHISIDHMVTHELDGLASFEETIEITANKDECGALGPAQTVVSE